MGPLDMGNARLNLEKRINQMLEDKIENTMTKIEDLRTALVDNGHAVEVDGGTDISGTLAKVMLADQMLEDKIEELEELLWTINDQLFDHFSKDWNLEGNKK